MTFIANPAPSRPAYACSACPVCSCAQRNAEMAQYLGGFTAQGSPRAEGATGVPGTLGTEAGGCSCALPGCARGSGVRFAGSAASTSRSEAAFSAFDKARETGLFGAVGRPAERTFTRAEVLAVLKSRKAILEDRPHFAEAVRELDTLIAIFERME